MDKLPAIIAALPGYIDWGTINNFKIILLSIVLEALPFVLFSVFVSAILNNFVSEDTIRKVIPRNKLLSIIPAALLGIIFPVCDCGMVPIIRRLVMKGVPLHTATAFMLAAPIINPVVTAATSFAFKLNGNMVIFRLGTTFLIACLAGWLVSIFFRGSELRVDSGHHHACNCCGPHAEKHRSGRMSLSGKLVQTIYDASSEFFEMGKYLLLGSMLGALSQVMLPRSVLLTVGQDAWLSIVVMMLFAFVISVCSAADAFIAASFANSFSPGSLVAFMVFGPMIDLKNIFMLLHSFRTRFVIVLSLIVTIVCGAAAYLINLW